MIQAYYAELTVSPIPLEASLNYCSHRCEFCFANLSNPGRVANVKGMSNLLASYRDRNTLEALLLREGYPVLLSNRVDPFAHSNYRQALKLIETLVGLGIPIAVQTRGGKGVGEALDMLPPSCWYVSINTTNEDLRRSLEPGATTTASRFELIAELRARGHRVVLGFNPAVEEWQPNPAELLQRAAAAGAEGMWSEPLHFNRQQVAALSPQARAAIGEVAITAASLREPTTEAAAYRERVFDAAHEAGMETFCIGQAARSEFWRPYHETYPKLFPTMQGFVNLCHEAEADVVTFGDYLDWFLPGLPEGENLPLDACIASIARNVVREDIEVPWHEGAYRVPPRMGYAEVLALFWHGGSSGYAKKPRIRLSPFLTDAFSYLGKPNTEGWTMLVDDFGLPLAKFHPDGGAGWWCEAERDAA